MLTHFRVESSSSTIPRRTSIRVIQPQVESSDPAQRPQGCQDPPEKNVCQGSHQEDQIDQR